MMARSNVCPVICYIGVGSNLGDPQLQVNNALQNLADIPSVTLLRRSPWYSSKAIGPGVQPDYINGVIEIETTLDPQHLLEVMQKIEAQQGRTRELRWGARSLDLDILLYGDQVIDSENLQIPHPRMKDRSFVLMPLIDLNPRLTLPAKHTPSHVKNETIASLLAGLPHNDQSQLWRVEGEHTVVRFEQVSFK